MKKWIPPIPAGALCSPDAIAINTALPLLGWCYDQVGRDGWFEINLHTVAEDIDVEYWTIKRWWKLLRESTFIAEYKEHGRGGMKARLADKWIDWRQLNARQTGANMRPNDEIIGTETGAKTLPNTDNRDRNGTETGANMRPNVSAYKVLIDSDQERGGDRERTAHALSHPAVEAYRKAFPNVQLNGKQQAIIRDLVGDVAERLECWRATIQDYELSPDWIPENIGNMRERFDRKWKDRQKQKGNTPAARTVSAPAYKPPVDVLPHEELGKALAERKKIRSIGET